jgi:uncharacterized membrane-anchored protein YhcB (DUF1043 family)
MKVHRSGGITFSLTPAEQEQKDKEDRLDENIAKSEELNNELEDKLARVNELLNKLEQ